MDICNLNGNCEILKHITVVLRREDSEISNRSEISCEPGYRIVTLTTNSKPIKLPQFLFDLFYDLFISDLIFI